MDGPTTRFTDRMADIFEQEGQPPIAGRILALLLVSEEPRCLDQLATTLRVSKASVSTNARLLAHFGVVTRARRPGDRRDFYTVVPDLFERTTLQRLEQWQRFVAAVGEARRRVPPRRRVVRARLEGYETAFAYLSGAIARTLVAVASPERDPEVRRALVVPLAAAVLVAGCVGTPSVSDAPSVSPAPETPWKPPPGAIPPDRAADTTTGTRVPPDLAERIRGLTLAEIVDLGLRNNPATRLAWANAQTAAATYGSQRGEWLPTIDGNVDATRIKTAATQGRTSVQQSVLTPSVSLSYLLFDFGGRTGRIAGARQRLIAASFTHNAAIQDVVLQIQVAYFQYLANRALVGAQRTTFDEAQTNLTAAEERRRVGLATIADVLQARTAASQAQLDLETIEGNLQTARGSLAVALGLPANFPYDVDSTVAIGPVASIADSVDIIIAHALEGRPDLAAIRAEAEAARADISDARSALLPSLGFTRQRRPHLRDDHSGRGQQLQPLAGPLHSDLQRLLPAVQSAGGGVRRRGGGGAGRVAPATGDLPGLQRVPRPADRDPPGPHHPGSAGQRYPVQRSRARPLQGGRRLGARPAGRPDRRSPTRGRSGWTRASPGACRWPSSRTTRASSTPPARARFDSLPRFHDGAHAMIPPSARILPALLAAALGCKETAPPQVASVPVTLGVAEQRAVPFELAATGTVEPLQTVAVQPQVSGPIDRIAFTEGQDVQKGQVLFEIDPRPFQAALAQAEALLERDRAQAENAQAEVKRYSELAEREYVTAQQYDQARTTAAAAAATLAGSQAAVTEAKLNLQYATIRAPISGRTGSLRVREGNLVRASDALPLVTINRIRPILVRFAVPAANLGLIQKYRSEKLVVRADPVGGEAPASTGTLASWTTRWIPPRARSCSRAASPTRTAASGRASS